MSVKQLSEFSGLSESTISKRLDRGWSIEEAIEIPNLRNNKKENK